MSDVIYNLRAGACYASRHQHPYQSEPSAPNNSRLNPDVARSGRCTAAGSYLAREYRAALVLRPAARPAAVLLC